MTLFVCLFFFWACLVFDEMENSLQIKLQIKFVRFKWAWKIFIFYQGCIEFVIFDD